MFKTGYELQQELKKIREEGELNPVKLGFSTWDDWDNGRLLMLSRGSWVLIGGEPHHGKTYFTNEIVMQLMEMHDFKVALISTESGNVAKVFSTFYGMYAGKHYSRIRSDMRRNDYAMNDDEKAIAEKFINEHLWVFEQNQTVKNYQSIENIYKRVADAEKQFNIKFDCVVIDPIYDVDGFEPKAEEVKRILTYIDYQCEISNRIDIVVNHVAETAKYVDKQGNRRKYRAGADEFYGGKNNQRKAKLQILVERPIPNTENELGEEYVAENQTNIHVLKAKPEGVAKMGTYKIYYDWKSRRYYEKREDGTTSYAQNSVMANKGVVVERQSTLNITANPNDAFGGINAFDDIELSRSLIEDDDDGLPF